MMVISDGLKKYLEWKISRSSNGSDVENSKSGKITVHSSLDEWTEPQNHVESMGGEVKGNNEKVGLHMLNWKMLNGPAGCWIVESELAARELSIYKIYE